MYPVSHNGPLCLIDGDPRPDDVSLAARILARYSQGKMADSVTVHVDRLDGTSEELTVSPCAPTEIQQNWHVGA